jgi:uncharacterized membrane protein YhdT
MMYLLVWKMCKEKLTNNSTLVKIALWFEHISLVCMSFLDFSISLIFLSLYETQIPLVRIKYKLLSIS